MRASSKRVQTVTTIGSTQIPAGLVLQDSVQHTTGSQVIALGHPPNERGSCGWHEPRFFTAISFFIR